MFVVAAMYKFVSINNQQCTVLQKEILNFCKQNQIKGTLILATEGINGTVAGTRSAIDSLISLLRSTAFFSDIEYKESFSQNMPFYRMKVKIKKEIVTMGINGIDPTKIVGTYLSPQEWNEMLQQPDVIVVDTRNDYEYEIGTFQNALNPETQNFRQFPQYVKENLIDKKDKKIAMFCTGGIRCEKSTAYLKSIGFSNVYHLKGGILKYLEEIPQENSKWQGECFVFDQRVAVGQNVEIGTFDKCHGCRMPLSEADKKLETYQEGVHCKYCFGKKSPKHYERAAERHKQVLLAKMHNTQHIGERLQPKI